MPESTSFDVLRFLQKACALHGTCDLTDHELLERFISNRDEGAFTFLVRRHGPVILRACQRLLGDSHDAEDALQTAFLVLVRQSRSIRRKESVGSWLFGVAQNVALKTRSREAARRIREREAGTKRASGSKDDMATRELRSVLDDEIGSLPEKYRGPVLLCCLEGKSYDKAARELGCPKSSLESRLNKAFELLRRKLERRGVTLAVGAVATTLGEMAAAAPLPATLTISTVKAATLVACGKAVAGGCLSAHVVELMNETLRGVVWVKAKMILAVAAIGLAAGGAGWTGYGIWSETGTRGSPVAAQMPQPKQLPNIPATEENSGAKDQNGDPLPPAAIARLGTLRFRQEGFVEDLIYAPDGKTLISRGGSVAILWDARTGKELYRISGITKDRYVSPIDISPDGSTLAYLAADDRSAKPEIVVADLQSGKILRTLQTPGKWPLKEARESQVLYRFFLRYLPDGKRLAIADLEGKVHIVDADTGKLLAKVEETALPAKKTQIAEVKPPEVKPPDAKSPDGKFPGMATNLHGLALSPDGKTMALGSSNGLLLIDTSTGKKIRQINPHTRGKTYNIAFSADCKKMAWADEDWIVISDPSTGAEQSRFNGNPTKFGMWSFIRSLAFLPDGKSLLAASGEGKVRHWDLPTGKLRQTFESHSTWGDAMALTPDGKTVAFGGPPPTIHFWNIETGAELFKEVQGHQAPVRHLAFTSDNKALVSAGGDQEIRVWNLTNWRQTDLVERAFAGHVSGYGEGLALSPDGKRVSRTPSANWFQISSLQIRVLSDGRENKLMDFTGTTRFLCSQFSTDGRKLFVVYGGDIPGPELQLRLWDTVTTEQEGAWKITLSENHASPWGIFNHSKVVLNADNKQAFIESDEGIRLYDVEAGKFRLLPTTRGLRLTGLSPSPDGRVLAGGVDNSSKTIVLWEIATGRLLHELKDHGLPVSAFAWSADGRFLASGDAKPFNKELLAVPSVKLWDTVTGKELAWFTGFKSGVSAVCLSPDGRFLAAGLKDSTILIWDVSQKTLAARCAPKELSAAELDACWVDLMSDEPRIAQIANWKMTDSPRQTVEFLKKCLKDVVAENSVKLKRLVTDLSSDQKAVRESALAELQKTVVNPLIDIPDASSLRNVRAIAALERIGTSDARAVLEALSRGAPGARETEEAKASLERLSQRAGKMP
jgi:RNA polymerase sigma factor (sigma-70 family)